MTNETRSDPHTFLISVLFAEPSFHFETEIVEHGVGNRVAVKAQAERQQSLAFGDMIELAFGNLKNL